MEARWVASPVRPLRPSADRFHPRPAQVSSMPTRRSTAPVVIRPLAIGSVLSRTMSTWLRHAGSFSALSIIVFLPLLAWTYLHTSQPRTLEEISSFQRWSGTVSTLLGMILSAAVIYGVLERLRGRSPGVGGCIARGLDRFFPVLGVSLLTGLYIGLAVLVLAIPVGLVLGVERDVGRFVYALAAVAVVATAILQTLYALAVPVAVVERAGVGQSMSRSARLTQGNRLRLLVLFLLWILLATGVSLGANKVFPDSYALAEFVPLGLTVLLFAPLGAISTALVYHDLRTGSEGATIEELTKVFD